MTSEEVENLLMQKEGLNIEFKRAGSGAHDDTFESVCSFLNRYGGEIILGVTNNGEVIGLPETAIPDMIKNLVNTANDPNLLSPVFAIFPEHVTCCGRHLIHIRVPQSATVHRWKGVCFDRINEADVKVYSTDAIAQMYIRKQHVYTEQRVYPYVTIKEMRLDLLPRVRKLARSMNLEHPWLTMDDEELLRSARFYGTDWETGKTGFNAAGVLCLGRDEVIQSLFPAYKTDAYVQRNNLDRYDDRDIVATNLVESYERLFAFGEKHLNDRFFLEKDQRVSLRSKILREVISNLLVHREYTSARPGRFVIRRDVLVADNANKALTHGCITPANLSPLSKNPIIAGFFQRIGRADELGSGVRNLFKYVREYAQEEPRFEEEDVFTLTVPISRVAHSSPTGGTGNALSTPSAAALSTPSVKLEHVSPRQFAILKALDEGDKENSDLLEVLGIKQKDDLNKRYLKPLIQGGAVVMRDPEHPNNPKQTYGITEFGKTLLNNK